jgi:hypothetical protein
MGKTASKAKSKSMSQYDLATRMFIQGFAAYVTEHFGARCPSKHQDCACCEMWKLYDDARDLTDVDG